MRPYPKAGPRNEQRRGRKKGRARILTETPEKNQIEQEFMERKKKKRKKKTVSPKKLPAKRSLFVQSTNSSDESVEENLRCSNLPTSDEEITNDITFGDFVLVKYDREKKSDVFFVGCVENYDENSYEISFLKKKPGNNFIYPDTVDVDTVPSTNIEMLLPKPKVTGQTKRSLNFLTFPNICFEKYNMGSF